MLMLIAAVLLVSSQEPAPQMRISLADLDMSIREDRALFMRRLEDETARFCTEHRTLITPSHVRAPRFCEEAMRGEALAALTPEHRRALRRDRQ